MIPALVAIIENANNEITIELVCQTSASTYTTTLSKQDLLKSRFLPDESSIQFLKRQLGSTANDNSPFYTKYEWNDGILLIQISQHLSSGLVRVVWETTLQQTTTAVYDFTTRLLQFYKDKQTSHDELTTAYHHLDKFRNEWKDTAEKLEHVWENEKNELLNNFLILYKKQQEITAAAQAELQQLKEQLDQTKQELENVKHSNNKNHDKAADMQLNDEPDDMDHEVYPQELVNHLAGTVSSTRRPQPNRKRSMVAQPKKARNTATGAIEYFDTDEALADLAGIGADTKSARGGGRNLNKTSKKTTKPVQKKGRTLKSTKDDSSSTDSTGHYSDNEMDSDVLAQLAAMKDMDE